MGGGVAQFLRVVGKGGAGIMAVRGMARRCGVLRVCDPRVGHSEQKTTDNRNKKAPFGANLLL